jgi:hypothetical protein
MTLRRGYTKTVRRLRQWLHANPLGIDGRPLYRLAGRTKLFSESDIERLIESLHAC